MYEQKMPMFSWTHNHYSEKESENKDIFEIVQTCNNSIVWENYL